ncbi:ATP-binding protein [Romboutsia sedimentorum]|uniref:ATP-binding protein n=1 Tax=Romboutsia sedimentorum TaxID=1368474 RepID=A0ABT7EEK9_9FIRM|nr:ATP-binding protein [Romboutsia sedimentorum]MDK2564518.1 ATP-binding protein [Romboutsia sedimentorum]
MNELTLRDILRSYEKRRDLAKLQLEERQKDVYSQIPEIKDIDEEISKLGLSLIKLVLQNPKDKDYIVADAKDKIDKLKEKKDFLLNKFNVPSGYLEIMYNCKVCNDKGFLQSGQKCNCFKQEIVNEAYKMSNLSRMLNTQNFSNFDGSLFSAKKAEGFNVSPRQSISEIFNICDDFVKNFEIDNNENLLFYGDTGLGKTFMSNCIAKEILDKGHIVIYQTAFKMFEIIEDYKFKNADEHISKDNYNNIFECDLLIIDDLGTELANSFTNSELFNILNTRLLNGKKTIISTNLTPSQLGEDYTQRIFSRIFDRFRMVKFIGDDLRWAQQI